ncbi:hypothetical protein WJX72_004622 [[Myrmecia] bisecta]|uniref:SET domain-containing protein n=1 Tax=[Myrmecia] bisecta TaxID=41462 RepID=A0AAW1PT95_9CHLO
MLKAVQRVLEKWSLRAIGNRLDKRQLQHELDIHRLFLVTSHFTRRAAGKHGGADLAAELAAEADVMGFQGMQEHVAQCLQSQILRISTIMHTALQEAGNDHAPATQSLLQAQGSADDELFEAMAAAAGPIQRPRGLTMAIGRARPSTQQQQQQQQPSIAQHAPQAEQDAPCTAAREPARSLSMERVSAIVQERLGYSLHVGPSAIGHQEAGEGLWLDGKAHLGSVVALYPGIVYRPLHYRQIPGYPRVDQDNDYLLARFDGAVLDAKPWGRGAAASAAMAGSLGPEKQRCDAAQTPIVHRLLAQETRHPLALAHFANHPPAGSQANVMVAAFDISPSDVPAWLPAYIPNVMYSPTSATAPASPASGSGHALAELQLSRQPMAGLALVALRDLHNEELLLNYRLSPHVARPDWYTPVDADEDNRRWA